MKPNFSSRKSQASSPRSRGKPGRAAIKLTAEHPELDIKHVVRVVVRRGLKPVLPKESVSLRIDADVLEWFKSMGPGYQTRINSILRAFKEAAV
jgi:uncharacterized protein (DUF4415 family)